MKKLLNGALVALAVVLMLASVAMADSIATGDKIYLTDGLGDNGGGIFNVFEFGKPAQASFETFCLELNEEIIPTVNMNFKHVYDVTIDTVAIKGGVGGGNPDPLDARTAFLYYKFRTNSLLGFTGSEADVNSLQLAMWFIEQELPSNVKSPYYKYTLLYMNDLKAATYVALAEAAIANGEWSGLGHVRVMNLNSYKDDKLVYNQSLLTLVPEPGILMLIGFGLIGLGAVRRKFSK